MIWPQTPQTPTLVDRVHQLRRFHKAVFRLQGGLGWILGAIAGLGWAGSSTAAPPPNPGPSPDQLRSPLIQALADWTWVSDRVVTVPPSYDGASHYWLVTLEPRREGEPILRYEFQQANSRYQRGDRSYFVRVGPRGCQRELTVASLRYGESRYPDLCLGDRLVVPIELEHNYSNYRFSDRNSVITQIYIRPQPPLPESFDPSPLPSALPKPIATRLKYLGRHFEMVSTAGGDRRVTWQAHWQAIATGRWNLELAMQPSPELQALTAGRSDDGVPNYVSGPEDKTLQSIAVLPVGQPLTVLPLTMRGNNYYGPGSAASNRSSVSDRFPVGQLVLRVGDRVQLPYGGAEIRRSSLPRNMNWQAQQAEIDRLAASANPVLIQQKPFAPPALESPIAGQNTTQRHFYDDWLVP